MFKRTKSSSSRGFTIVEVMFVLAIAGMIMLIVFLAVPALQRNARNTQRKSDASRVAAALTDFVSNSNGALPSLGTAWATDCDTVVKDAGKLGAANVTLKCGPSDGSAANSNFLSATPAGKITTPLTANRDAFLLDEKAVCSSPGTTTSGQSRQMALLYTVEGGGNYQWSCIQAN